MRSRLLCFFAFALFAFSQSANAQDDAETRAQKSTYQLAMQCFVAEGVAVGFDRHLGDEKRAEELERRTKLSFGASKELGAKLGYSDGRMNKDLESVQTEELPKFGKDIQYLKSQIAKCEYVGI